MLKGLLIFVGMIAFTLLACAVVGNDAGASIEIGLLK